MYNLPKTIITEEYPAAYQSDSEPYYPINDMKNNTLADSYLRMAVNEANVIFGGRLARYRYYDMDAVIERALSYFA